MDTAAPPPVQPPLSAAESAALVYVQDRDSEGVIRQCLSDLGVATPEFHSGGVDDAVAALALRHSPHLLIVDVNNVDDPAARIRDLANVCDPTTGVIVIGDTNDIRLYRDLKAAGIFEYFFKPLVRTLVMQSCNSIITGSSSQVVQRSGKLIFVMGVRGGVGATTIGVTTAWHLAETRKRRVAVLDLDLQFGDAALQLDATPTHALKEALTHPDRVDELFLDRGMARVGERLGVFAALESLDDTLIPENDAVLSLLERMLRRNRYVLVQVPITSAPHLMSILHLPGTVVLVSGGSLVCARDIVRVREKLGANSAERTTIQILNKNGDCESLSEKEFASATGTVPDIVVPYAPEIAAASRLGVQGLQKCTVLQRGLQPLFRQLSGEEPVVAKRSLLSSLFG